MEDLDKHYKPQNKSDHVALAFTKFLRFIADTFFKKKYGHRAVVLETVAAVPGMVAGMLMHLKSLRKMEDDKGWIKLLLEEAENERMHLMTFIQVAKPTSLERFIIIVAQFLFILLYSIIYHRFMPACKATFTTFDLSTKPGPDAIFEPGKIPAFVFQR